MNGFYLIICYADNDINTLVVNLCEPVEVRERVENILRNKYTYDSVYFKLSFIKMGEHKNECVIYNSYDLFKDACILDLLINKIFEKEGK
jgi:hypothetical protein